MPAATRRALAMTSARELAAECAVTQRLMHAASEGSQLSVVAPERLPSKCLDLCELDALRDDLRALRERAESDCLSEQEEEYARELTAAIVHALAAAYASGAGEYSTRADGPAEARLWLLELAVQPSPVSRHLAFLLLFDVCVVATSIAVTGCTTKETENHPIGVLQDELFTSLREMLAKAAVVASVTAVSRAQKKTKMEHNIYSEILWVRAATECLILLTRVIDAPNTFRRDRLGQLDRGALRYLIETVAMSPSNEADLQLNLSRFLLANLSASTSGTPQPSKCFVDVSIGRPPSICSSAFSQSCSVELLLVTLYTTPSTETQRMLFRVLFELACEQLAKSKTAAVTSCKDPELLWKALLEQDFIARCVQTPLLFSSPAIPRIAKSLATAYPSLYDKSTLAVLLQLQRLLHIEDYFDQSSGLAKIIQVAMSQGKNGLSGKLMQKVDELLISTNVTDRFRGELWLAELLVFSNYSKSETKAVSESGGEAEITDASKSLRRDAIRDIIDPDESNEVRSAAQSRVWELAATADDMYPFDGHSFARIVTLFIRRLIRPEISMASVMGELAMCVKVLVDLEEKKPDVLSKMMLLVIEICRVPRPSAVDRRRINFDQSNFTDQLISTEGESIESSANQMLNGEIALDTNLLSELDPSFFLLVAKSLALHVGSTSHDCRGTCCDLDRSIDGDIGVCAAFVLFDLCEGSETVLAQIGGTDNLLPFLHSCNTRVAVMAAHFLRRQIKKANPTKYFALLREMSSACADQDSADVLSNTHLHVRTLLRSGADVGVTGTC